MLMDKQEQKKMFENITEKLVKRGFSLEIKLLKKETWEDAPEPNTHFQKSVVHHQIYPVVVNKIPGKNDKIPTVFEVVDGRGRVYSLFNHDIENVIVDIYEGLTQVEKSVLSYLPHRHRRKNYITLYKEIQRLEVEGINPIEIQEKFLRLDRHSYEKMKSIRDNLIEDLIDAFVSGDKGFSFNIAFKVSKLREPLQQKIYDEYFQENGKVTIEDIRHIKMAQANKDLSKIMTPDLMNQIQENLNGNWQHQAKELVRRLGQICPVGNKLSREARPHVDALIKMWEKYE